MSRSRSQNFRLWQFQRLANTAAFSQPIRLSMTSGRVQATTRQLPRRCSRPSRTNISHARKSPKLISRCSRRFWTRSATFQTCRLKATISLQIRPRSLAMATSCGTDLASNFSRALSR
jgi:hypothetical protein